ncbi:Coronin-2B [Drechslerella dactyloides]|uniref:Coronin-2B n=1 Tax=Drechslerella dactyloides TaxID=74499 RepID=A0AAD6J3P7_DREDA|nr:Coronin-2B [Drechslerella dactyloides]
MVRLKRVVCVGGFGAQHHITVIPHFRHHESFDNLHPVKRIDASDAAMSGKGKRKAVGPSDDDDLVIDSPFVDPNDPMAAFLPKSFGKQAPVKGAVKHSKPDRGNPSLAPSTTAAPPLKLTAQADNGSDDRGSSNDDDDSDDSDDSDEDELPTSHELAIKDHEKAVTSVSLDPSGMRMVTASHDSNIKFYDFTGMASNHLHSFKTVEPREGHLVHKAEFSNNGDSILVIPSCAQAKVFDRDGYELVEFVKGDQYLRDMNNTKGHVSEVLGGTWHPTDKNLLVTCSSDSTVRIWDVNQKRQQKEVIVVKSRTSKGGRTRVMCVKWDDPTQGGKKLLGAGSQDGSLTLWGGDGGPFSRPMATVEEAHEKEAGVCSIAFSKDGNLMVSRGMDGTVKSWDTRKFKKPIMTRTDLPAFSQDTTISFSPDSSSPDSSSVLTSDSGGNLHILSPATLRSESTVPVTPSAAVIATLWHPRLNQIFTTSADATVKILYSPKTSARGALTILSNALKKRHLDDDASLTTDIATGINADAIYLPNAVLPSKTKSLAAASTLANAYKPFKPHTTPFAKSTPDEEHIKKNVALSGMRDEDPREALLRYADKAKTDPMFTGAWKETQPVTIYSNEQDEDEEEEEDRAKRQKRF